MARSADVKKVLMIATGGTIACVQTNAGLAPGISAEELLACVPEAKGLCHVDTRELFAADSTNIGPQHWLGIAHAIVAAYDDYDAFVVTHGTDTMAYSAAALSYLVQGSVKPIVFTGSQLPMSDVFTDAKTNLFHSLLYAVDDESHDVALVFGGIAIAGTRASKRRTISSRAFESVNFPELATFCQGSVVRSGALPQTAPKAMRTFDALNDRVVVLKLVPGCDASIFGALAPCYDAVIVEGFGLGGIPDTRAYRDAVFDWLDSGRLMVMASQAPEEGIDWGRYEVSHAYAQRGGMLVAGDMTTEAVVAKTMWVLGRASDPERVACLFNQPVNHDRR